MTHGWLCATRTKIRRVASTRWKCGQSEDHYSLTDQVCAQKAPKFLFQKAPENHEGHKVFMNVHSPMGMKMLEGEIGYSTNSCMRSCTTCLQRRLPSPLPGEGTGVRALASRNTPFSEEDTEGIWRSGQAVLSLLFRVICPKELTDVIHGDKYFLSSQS